MIDNQIVRFTISLCVMWLFSNPTNGQPIDTLNEARVVRLIRIHYGQLRSAEFQEHEQTKRSRLLRYIPNISVSTTPLLGENPRLVVSPNVSLSFSSILSTLDQISANENQLKADLHRIGIERDRLIDECKLKCRAFNHEVRQYNRRVALSTLRDSLFALQSANYSDLEVSEEQHLKNKIQALQQKIQLEDKRQAILDKRLKFCIECLAKCY